MLRFAGPLLLISTLASGGEVHAEPSVKDALREVSGMADEVVGRAQFIEQQFRQKSVVLLHQPNGFVVAPHLIRL